jgi:hypothetical protein
MRVGLVSIVSSIALVVVSSVTFTVAGMAQSAPFCADAQSVDWLDAFAPLSEQLGEVMGEPVECAHQTSDSGDTVQQTSTGLAILRSPSGLATFTDGTTRWALTTDRGLLSWMGTSLDPPRREIPCRSLPIRGFGQVFGTMDEAFGLIGCPWSAETGVDVATQRFEHGWMVWRASRDTWDPATIFVLFEDDQHYVRFDDTYSPTADPESGNAIPPPGLLQPVRGFGKVWREGTAARVRDRLGWAKAPESAGRGAMESFDRGALLWTPEPRQIFLLAATTAHRPQQVLQVWRGYADTFTE